MVLRGTFASLCLTYPLPRLPLPKPPQTRHTRPPFLLGRISDRRISLISLALPRRSHDLRSRLPSGFSFFARHALCVHGISVGTETEAFAVCGGPDTLRSEAGEFSPCRRLIAVVSMRLT